MRILFVCLGNICRSPTAEGVMKQLVAQQNLTSEFVIESAGTAGWHVGASPDSRTIEAAERKGIALTSRAQQFHTSDFDSFDLVVAMDRKNRSDLLALANSREQANKVSLLCEYLPDSADRAGGQLDVPDPYYGSTADFDFVVELVAEACQGLLAHCLK